MLGEHIKVIRKARGAVSTGFGYADRCLPDSPDLGWDYQDSQSAVLGTAVHFFEWLLVRAAPFIFAGTIAGAVITRKRE